MLIWTMTLRCGGYSLSWQANGDSQKYIYHSTKKTTQILWDFLNIFNSFYTIKILHRRKNEIIAISNMDESSKHNME